MARVGRAFIGGSLILGLSFVYIWGVPTACVRLPNGLNIGKQALLDLSRPYFRPDIVPKFPNGRSLLPGDAWPFYATETTVHGRAEQENHRDDFWFAWREDTGLVLKRENPKDYEDILSQAGALLKGTKYGGYDSHIMMMELEELSKYKDQTCRTRWLTW